MTFIVMITPTDKSTEAEPVGPFPDIKWAKRYVERVKKCYHRVEIVALLSPTLLDPSITEGSCVVFDPEKGIDR